MDEDAEACVDGNDADVVDRPNVDVVASSDTTPLGAAAVDATCHIHVQDAVALESLDTCDAEEVVDTSWHLSILVVHTAAVVLDWNCSFPFSVFLI